MNNSFKIIRHFANGGKQTINTGLTLEEAKAHCKDPETSSTTATSPAAKQRTKDRGPWFDGFKS